MYFFAHSPIPLKPDVYGTCWNIALSLSSLRELNTKSIHLHTDIIRFSITTTLWITFPNDSGKRTHNTCEALLSLIFNSKTTFFIFSVMRWTIKASSSKRRPTAGRFLCKKIYRLQNRKTKNNQMKVFPEVFVVCMAVREASVVFYVLFVSECEGGIGTESRQRGTSSAASVKRAFDNTGTLSTSYTDYTEPLDTDTHVPSLKDTQSCHTVDMAQHHPHRDTGNALECNSMGLSSCGRLASVLGFIPVNVHLNHSEV